MNWIVQQELIRTEKVASDHGGYPGVYEIF